MRALPLAINTTFVVAVAVGVVRAWEWERLAAFALVAAALGVWMGQRRAAALAVACLLATLALGGAAHGSRAIAEARAPSLVALLEQHHALAADGANVQAPVRLRGRLLADATDDGRGVRFRVAVDRAWVGPCGCAEPVAGRVLVAVSGEAASGARHTWRRGRTVAFTATLRRPVPYRNAGAPDDDIAVARRGVALVASVKSAWLVELVSRGTWLDEAASDLRAQSRLALARAAGAGSDAAAIATAVLIGDRAGIERTLEDRLARAGTVHVIAISGGNIAVWAVIVLAVAARVTRRRPVALAGAAVVLLLYATLVGGGASVLRATGMALIGLAIQWIDLRAAAAHVLAVTAALLVAVDPLVAVDIGFWLTTAATAGLVVGLTPSTTAEPRARRLVRALLVTSVWAEVAVLPIVAAVFQQVTVAGLLLSAVAVPAMAVVQVAAALAVPIDALVPSLLPAVGVPLRLAASVVTESARLVDLVPWLAWRVAPPSPLVVGLYYVVCAAWIWARLPRSDTAAAGFTARLTRWAAPAAVVWVVTAPGSWRASVPGELRVSMLDVGQGEAVLVESPSGHRLLVDAGGSAGVGRDAGGVVVGPTLRARGIRRLDTVLVTHGDLDHIGGAVTLVREFRPREVWVGITVADSEAERALRAAADEVGALWREVRRGERLAAGAVRMEVLHPPPPDWERQRVRNDDSVVLALRYGRLRFLLTGDIGRAVEADIAGALARPSGDEPVVTILKVAHHGSGGATSDAWLEAVAPAVAIVSAGAANPFGHPAASTLDRLAARGIDVWRTDRDGEVSVRSNGRDVAIRAHDGRERWLPLPTPGRPAARDIELR